MTNVPRKSDPDLREVMDCSIDWRLGGVLSDTTMVDLGGDGGKSTNFFLFLAIVASSSAVPVLVVE